jgi:hypothetical protein
MAILLVAQATRAAPVHEWTQRYGGLGADVGAAVAFDVSGHVLVVGTSNHDMFAARYDASGSQLWIRWLGQGYAYDVTSDPSGNVLVTGGLGIYPDVPANPQTSILIVKFDANGTQRWERTFGTTGGTFDEGIGIATDASGDVAVTGRFLDTVDLGGGPLTSAGRDDIFVAKFSAQGNHLWSRRAGSATYREYGSGITVDGSGNVVVVGSYNDPMDMGGGVLPYGGSLDMFLAKYASVDGAHLWSHGFGSTNQDDGTAVVCDGSNNVILLGRFGGSVDFGGGALVSAGTADVVLARYGANGMHEWSKRFGDVSYTSGNGVATDPLGNIVVAGMLPGTVDFGGGPIVGNGAVFVAKFNPSGGHLWSESYGGGYSAIAGDVAVSSTGRVAVTGRFFDSIDFGGGDVVSADSSDAFIAKFTDDSYVPVPIRPVETPGVTLGENHPNPFNPVTTIEYSVDRRAAVVIGIYDSRGTLVARLDDGVREAGNHRVRWDGRNTGGQRVASGMYFYRLEGTGVPARKMVLLK